MTKKICISGYYGFDNFDAVTLDNVNNEYAIDNHFFTTDIDLLGNSKTILSLNKEDYIVLPNTITIEDLNSKVTFDKKHGEKLWKFPR